MSLLFESVGFEYAPGHPVFNDLSIGVSAGQCLLVVGHNGAGKSTFLKLLNGILKPTAGRVTVFGNDTATTPTSILARDVCVTFQNPGDQIFASKVRQEILFGPRSLRRERPENFAHMALELFGLSGCAELHPYDLSQPERKLLTVASAVATGAPLLAIDEPSVSLSQRERKILLSALSSLRESRRTLIIVSHDLGMFLPLADRLLVLRTDAPPSIVDAAEIDRHDHLLRKSGVRFPYVDRLERIVQIIVQPNNANP
jgi:energy-coupling factor transport system ATP-binding protein